MLLSHVTCDSVWCLVGRARFGVVLPVGGTGQNFDQALVKCCMQEGTLPVSVSVAQLTVVVYRQTRQMSGGYMGTMEGVSKGARDAGNSVVEGTHHGTQVRMCDSHFDRRTGSFALSPSGARKCLFDQAY